MGLILNAFRLMVGGGGGYDSDAEAYFTATGLVDTVQLDALNDLVIGLKADGLWTECVCIFPFPGDTSAINSVNLKSPGTFDLTYYGGITHSSTGMLPNGSTGYADTGLVPASYLASNDTHLSYYSRTSNTVNGYDIGCFSGVNYHGIGLSAYYSYAGYTAVAFGYDGSYGYDAAELTSAISTDSQGFFVASRISDVSHTMYKDGNAGVTKTNLIGNFASIVDSIKIGATSYEGSIPVWGWGGARECAFVSIGFGLTGSQVTALTSRVQTYQTALGRQV